MSITKDQVIVTKEEKGTPGGVTYYVIRRNDPEKKEQPMCFRLLRNKEPLRCSQWAGKGTWHTGQGACSLHGGLSGGNKDGDLPAITTGRHSVVTRARLKGTIEAYLNEDKDKLVDLSLELAAMRAIFEEMLSIMPDTSDENYGIYIGRLQGIVGTAGTLVDKISKIESRNTLTAAQALYLRTTVADILMKYITDPLTRERAVKELATRVQGATTNALVTVT